GHSRGQADRNLRPLLHRAPGRREIRHPFRAWSVDLEADRRGSSRPHLGREPDRPKGQAHRSRRPLRDPAAPGDVSLVAAWLYILSCADGSYYVGTTRDSLEKRVAEHQAGAFGGYTARRRPVTLVFQQSFERIEDAIAAERQIKGWR